MSRLAKHAAWAVVLTAIAVVCFATEKPQVIPVVPQSNWRFLDSHPLPLAVVSQYGGYPAVEQEYGVKGLELRTYQLGKTTARVVEEQAADTPSAYGLLTFYQTREMSPPEGIKLAMGDANQTLMARGDKFLRFLRGKDSTDSDYHALLLFVGGSEPSPTATKALPSPMPPEGLVPGSEKYLMGLEAAKRALPSFRTDLIGFSQGAEVQLGGYTTGKTTSTLVSIGYPNPQIARLRYGELRSFLSLNQNHGPDSDYGRRSGSYVFLVLNAENSDVASTLMNRFQVTEGVSWDHPYTSERTFTMQLVHMFLAIFLLTAILIGACIIAGLLFFLSRRIAAKFFPEAQWGKTDEDQLIRLNLKIQ